MLKNKMYQFKCCLNVLFDFLEALDKYRSKNGMLPKSIIIYRDGVGDGQLSYVHSIEISNIKVSTHFYLCIALVILNF